MLPVASLAVSFLLSAPAMAEEGLSYSQLRLPELPAAQGLPLRAFAYPGDGWRDEQVQACVQGAVPAGVPLRYAALVLRGDGIWLEGERVLALQAGALPAGELGAAETALRGALGDLAARGRASLAQGCAPWTLQGEQRRPLDRLLLVSDGEIPASTAALVGRQAGGVGFTYLAWAAAAPVVGERWEVPPPEPDGADPDSPFPLLVTLELAPGGIQLSGDDWHLMEEGVLAEHGEGPRVPCARPPCTRAAAWDWDALGGLAARIQAERPGEGTVILVPSGEQTTEALLHAAVTVSLSAEGAVRIPHVVLATGEGPASEPEPVGARKKRDAGELGTEGQVPVVVLATPGSLSGGLGSRGDGPFIGGLGTRASGGLGTRSSGGLGTHGSGQGAAAYGGFGSRTAAGTMSIERVKTEGSLAEADVQEFISTFHNVLLYCYAREAAKQPELKGTVGLRFAVDAAGTVSDVVVESLGLGSPVVGSCLCSRFERIDFSGVKGVGPTVVRVELAFEKAAGE